MRQKRRSSSFLAILEEAYIGKETFAKRSFMLSSEVSMSASFPSVRTMDLNNA